ncbi:MAG: condensation domain-containing protein, partial [Ktedonobacteraceae bacterium]
PNGEVGEEERYTYAKLDQQARAIAAHLQELGLEGERGLLLYPPGLEYIAAFFGCLYAGVTAVPIYPPRSHKPTERLQAIVADTQAKVALSTSLILAGAEQWLAHTPDLQALKRLATDTIQVADAERWREPSSVGEETLAFLQYTSGSTSTPKGVMLTHGNLLYNSALIYQGFELNEESRGVSWLPPYHDMGLIGGILQPLYCGIPVTLMSPVAFLQSPLRWLQAVAHTGATVSGGPNFAYELCVRKISPEQRAELDLSSWRVAFCGAEPIRYETLEHFAGAFKPCGFHWESFYPCYGLAEATLIVSGGKQASPPVVERFQKGALEERCVVEEPDAHAETQTFVGCGKALGEQAIVIVEPESALQCADDRIGEIWVAGPSVARGYWKCPDETKNTFQAHLADTDEGPFLRTGDLGFLRDGELFVTGRIKDLIIIRGRNYYPQDIELAVEQCHPALRPGCGAAFSVVKDGEERLVIVQEVARHHQHADAEEVASAVRKSVAEQFELQVYSVVLIKTGSLPKTSSGKIQRYLCRERFLSSSLDIVGSSILDATPAETAQSASEQPSDSNYIHRALGVVHDPTARHALLTLYLQDQASRVLHMSSSQVNAHSALSTFGIDSLMAIELKNEIETDLGVILPVTTLFQDVNISQLATEVLALLDRSDSSDEALSGRPILHEAPPDEYPLSQGQRSLWFLYRLAPDSAAYNITCAIRIHAELDVAALVRAFEKLIERHAPLRTVFASTQGEPVQRTLPASTVRLHREEVANETSLQERLAVEAHRPFNLEEGPVLRVSLFTCSAQEHVLMLVVHHIVADFWSLVVLMRELGTLYATEKAHVPPSLPSLQVHYTDYVHWQADMLSSAEGERHWNYWQQQLAGDLPVLNLPADHPRPTVQRYQGANYHFELDEELTQRIKSLCQRENVTLYMILLAAFQVLLHRYTGQDDILVGTPAAGRNRAQLSGLIGYFVNTIVLRAHPSPQMTFKLFLEQVRQAVLEAFDHQDYPFPLLVERLQPRRNPSHSPIFQAMFALQKAPQFNEENLAAFAMGEAGIRAQLGDLPVESLALDQQIAQFDVSLMMAEVQGRLTGLFQYNTDLFEGERIEWMGQHYQRLLEALVAAPEQRIADLPLLSEPER